MRPFLFVKEVRQSGLQKIGKQEMPVQRPGTAGVVRRTVILFSRLPYKCNPKQVIHSKSK